MEGDKACAFQRNTIVAPSPFTLLFNLKSDRNSITTKNKIETKIGIFFNETALQTCPINLDTASGVERAHWVVCLWVLKQTLPKRNKNTLVAKRAHRKLSNRCGTYSMNCSPCPEGRICVDSIHCCSKHAKTANKPFPISSKWCYSWAYFPLFWESRHLWT